MNKQLHVLHVSASISRKGGGVAAFLWWLIDNQLASGYKITVVGLQDEFVELDTEKYKHLVDIVVAPPTLSRALGWSFSLRNSLKKYIYYCDVIHVHGIRTLMHHDIKKIAAQFNKPIVTSTHGQLYPQVLQKNVLRKKLTAMLFMDSDLKASAIIHVTSKQEAGFVKQYLPNLSTHIIPIGVDSKKYLVDSKLAMKNIVGEFKSIKNKRIILFLGLLHPKKGLVKLAEIWGKLSQQYPDWHLIIAGPDDGAEQIAKTAFKYHCHTNSVTWTGPVYGQKKIDLFAASELFILPTDWENFGIAVLESLAAGTPVITTNTTPWDMLQEKNCGWCVSSDLASLQSALNQALSLTIEDLQCMGEQGQMLVQQCFESCDCANQFKAIYQNILSGNKVT